MIVIHLFLTVFLAYFMLVSTSSEEKIELLADLSEDAPDPGSLSKEWPEQNLPSDSDNKPRKLQQLENIIQAQEQQENDDEGPQNNAMNKVEMHEVESTPELSKEHDMKKLIDVDYFRTDSKESEVVEKLLSVVEHTGSLDKKELNQYKAEIEAADMTRLTGSNWHFHQPDRYPDFSRRFVPQYPYTEVFNNVDQDAEDNSLTPKLAPPELVLDIAKESAMLAAASPINPTEELIQKDALRTGEYWNAFWQEDIEPKDILRIGKRQKLQSVRAKLSPGTEIYEIVSKLKKVYPKLLYVINKKNH